MGSSWTDELLVKKYILLLNCNWRYKNISSMHSNLYAYDMLTYIYILDTETTAVQGDLVSAGFY